MQSFINADGKLLPHNELHLAADNRAFRYGYGLFETMLVRHGAIRLEAYHWERLFSGMSTLQIQAPKFFQEELQREVMRTVRKNRLEDLARVRLQIYAGGGGLYDGEAFKAGYVIEVFALENSILQLNEAGLTLGISDVMKPTSNYAHLKTSAALPYLIAARQAKTNKWNDALLLNERGNIADSTLANIFWLSGRQACTPPLSEGCVAGVMRRHLLLTLPGLGFSVEEKAVNPSTLDSADGVILTNAIRGIRWVGEIDDRAFDPGYAAEIHAKAVMTL